MPDNWRRAYGELKDYINRNTGIEIDKSAIVIPDDVRPDFYRLFSNVCVSFGKDNIPALLEKTYELSRQWGRVSQSVMEDLKLESIDADASTKWFLLDPNDCLMRELFDTLFDLLKCKIDLGAFEQNATSVLEDRFTKLYRDGYKCWAIVSLLKLLSADKVYHIPRSDFDHDPTLYQELPRGSREEDTPDTVETNKISLEHNHMFSFMVPKVLVNSTRLGLFAALGSDFNFNEARWRARKLGPGKEWYKVSEIKREFGTGNIWPDLAIYTGANLKELVVIADYFQMARPDIIVEFREGKNWYEKEKLDIVRRNYNVLKPRLGSFVVCLEPVPEIAVKELEDKPVMQRVDTGATHEAAQPALQSVTREAVTETPAQPSFNIRLLSVGYDLSKLEPIVGAILSSPLR